MFNFQDGSYSRGPIDIPIGEVDDSNYYLSPTFKFEQVSLHATETFDSKLSKDYILVQTEFFFMVVTFMYIFDVLHHFQAHLTIYSNYRQFI